MREKYSPGLKVKPLRQALYFLITLLVLYFSIRQPVYAGDIPAKESFTIKDKSFLPLRFYIGDITELRLIIDLASAMKLTPPAPEKLPQSKWLYIKQVEVMQITETQYEVRIFFITFKPGNHQLPPIKLGKITITGLALDARSILDDRKITLPVLQPKPQLLLPGTWVAVGFIFFLIVFLPYLIVIGIRFGSKLVTRIKLAALREQPRNKILKCLKKIKHQITELEPRSFFNELALLLKEFLNDRFGLPVLPATTTEIKQILYNKYPHMKNSKQLKDLLAFLKTADYIRFGGKPIKKKEMNSLVDNIIALVGTLDKLEDNQRVEL